MITPLSSRFPQALDDDDDDVAWALQTALVQWKRGGPGGCGRLVAASCRLGRPARPGLARRGLAAQRRRADRGVGERDGACLAAVSVDRGCRDRRPARRRDDDGLDAIDVASGQVPLDQVATDPAGPLASYASVDDSEFEEDVLPLDDDEVEVEVERTDDGFDEEDNDR